MADKVAIDLLINAAGAAKSVKELKQSVKDLKNAALEVGEGSKDFARLTNAAAEAQDQMNDLGDAVRALDKGNLGQNVARIGSTIAGGFQAAQGAMALFGQESEDVQKALLKVQAATAMAQGIQSVGDLGKAFKALFLIVQSNPLIAFSAVVVALGTAFYSLFKNMQDANSETVKMERANQKLKETNELLTKQYDTEIIALTGLAENESKIIELKRKKILLTIQEAESNLLLAKSNKDRLAEQQKELSFSQKLLIALGGASGVIVNSMEKTKKVVDDVTAATNDLALAKANLNQIDNEQAQKAIDNQKKLNEELLAKRKKFFEEDLDISNEFRKNAQDDLDRFAKVSVDETISNMEMATERSIDYMSNVHDSFINQSIYRNARFIESNQQTFDATVQLFASLESLSEQGSASQKSFAIGQATINTYLAASKALATLPYPAAPIAAAAALIQGFANVRNILKTPTKSRSVPSSSSFSAGRNTNTGIDINPVRSVTSTTIDSEKVEQGQSVVRAYVVESDITKKQNSIKSIEAKSKI